MASKIAIEKPEQPKLAEHDSSILDLAFVMDCTGSMGSYIDNARNSIRKIVEEIVASEKSDVRLALVEYRDHPPQDATFVTRPHDFTGSVKEMKTWLDNCSANGGGDGPEAVADGLHDALKLSWREKSTKICILISDAPPHGLGGAGDGFPNGCPAGIDPIQVVRQMAEKGITLYSVGCEPALLPHKDFFTAIAYTTGGQYVPLRNANLLAKVIIGGAQEEISLERLMEDVQQEVEQQLNLHGGVVDEKAFSSAVHAKLKSQGAMAKNLKMNQQQLERASENAVKYSKMANLSDLRSAYKVEAPRYEASLELKSASKSSKAVPMMSRVSNLFSMKKSNPSPTSAPSPAPAPAPAPAPSSSSISFASPAADEYTVDTEEVNEEQAERLVQKALNRRKK